MGDYYPAEIHIGGPIPRAALDDLIGRILAEGASLDGYGEPAATEEGLREAFQQGGTVHLCDEQASFGQFEALEAFLVEHGVHFDRHCDAYHEYDAENVHYRGGEPLHLPSDQAGNILLHSEDVLNALNDGSLDDCAKIDAIHRLAAPPETAPLSPVRLVSHCLDQERKPPCSSKSAPVTTPPHG